MTVHRSRTPDIDIPATTVSGLIATAVARHADRTAIIDAHTARHVTYLELGAAVERAARGFRTRGMARGDVAAIVAANSLDWMIAALGIIGAGGVVTGANPASVVEELAHQFRDSGSRWVITSPSAFDNVAVAAGTSGCVQEIVVLGDRVADVDGLGVVAFSVLADHDGTGHSADGGDGVGLDDCCALPYSSGTTGRSKGVQLTHRTLVANISQVGAVAPVEAGDPVLAFLPMFHIMGFAVVRARRARRRGDARDPAGLRAPDISGRDRHPSHPSSLRGPAGGDLPCHPPAGR